MEKYENQKKVLKKIYNKYNKCKMNLCSAMLRTTNDDMECGMWGDV
jgi:hypothetical protein